MDETREPTQDPDDTEAAKEHGRARGGPDTPPDPGGEHPRRDDDDGRGDGEPAP